MLVPPGDAAALAAALTRLLGDPGLRDRLGAAASARADDYSVAALGRRYTDLLLGIVGQEPGGRG